MLTTATILIFCFLRVPSALSVEVKNASDLVSTRIIGGHDVREEEVPYQILLRMPGTLCGGVLIKVEEKQAVLTAAHCVPSSRRPNDITLVAGNVQLRKESSNEQRRSVTRIIRHSYNSRTMENDIAILALDSPFVENQFVQPIPLPSRNQETSGNVVASGWGLTSQRGRSSDTLKSVIVQVVPQQKCRNAYRRAWKRISDSMLCAAASGKDSCAGDSGGPLRSENGNYLAGIVSWGVGCARATFPGVYVKVSKYVEWIETNVRRL